MRVRVFQMADTLTLPLLRNGSLPLPRCGRGAFQSGGAVADAALVLRQLNPAQELRIPRDDVAECHLVVGVDQEG